MSGCERRRCTFTQRKQAQLSVAPGEPVCWITVCRGNGEKGRQKGWGGKNKPFFCRGNHGDVKVDEVLGIGLLAKSKAHSSSLISLILK